MGGPESAFGVGPERGALRAGCTMCLLAINALHRPVKRLPARVLACQDIGGTQQLPVTRIPVRPVLRKVGVEGIHRYSRWEAVISLECFTAFRPRLGSDRGLSGVCHGRGPVVSREVHLREVPVAARNGGDSIGPRDSGVNIR